MLLRAKMNLKAVDNVTQPQKPHWEPVQVCLWFPSKSVQKPKTTSVTKIRKTALFLPKNRKTRWYKTEKQETATDNKTEKTKFFNAKTEKPTYKMAKTEKPKIPTPPSSI